MRQRLVAARAIGDSPYKLILASLLARSSIKANKPYHLVAQRMEAVAALMRLESGP